MGTARTRLPRAALAVAVFLGTVATPLAKAPWQGMQLDASVKIDTALPRAELVIDLPASAFVFQPVVVTIEGKPDAAKKVVDMQFKVRNNSDDDYYLYTTATLVDAQDAIIVSKSAKTKADDDDNESFGIKFKLPVSELGRIDRCKLRFGFAKE